MTVFVTRTGVIFIAGEWGIKPFLDLDQILRYTNIYYYQLNSLGTQHCLGYSYLFQPLPVHGLKLQF